MLNALFDILLLFVAAGALVGGLLTGCIWVDSRYRPCGLSPSSAFLVQMLNVIGWGLVALMTWKPPRYSDELVVYTGLVGMLAMMSLILVCIGCCKAAPKVLPEMVLTVRCISIVICASGWIAASCLWIASSGRVSF